MSTNGATNSKPKKRRDWRPIWLEALRETGTVVGACEIAGIDRSTPYRERQANEDFALAWHDIEHETTDLLEKTAVQIALEGNVTMLIFMLKCRKPEVYTERHHLEHSGQVSLLDLERALDEAGHAN